MEFDAIEGLPPNIERILIDEISLEGLLGCGLQMLWKRVALRAELQLTEETQKLLWSVVSRLLDQNLIDAFLLPVAVPNFDIITRFRVIHEPTGLLKDPIFESRAQKFCTVNGSNAFKSQSYFFKHYGGCYYNSKMVFLDGPYEYEPAMVEYGSCKYMDSRMLIPKSQIVGFSLDEVEVSYERSMVLVACREERWRALGSHVPSEVISSLTRRQYCFLELIGRGRQNGQTIMGKTNILKITDLPDSIDSIRKTLKRQNLIKTSRITIACNNRIIRTPLLRLIRFHQNPEFNIPRVGKIHDTVQYLKTQPFCTATKEDVLSRGLVLPYSRRNTVITTVTVSDYLK